MTQQAPNWHPAAIPTSIGWLHEKTGEQLIAAKGLEPAAGTEGAVPNSPAWAAAHAAAVVVPPEPAVTNTVLPKITGTAQVGQALTSTPGTWTGAPAAYARKWYRDEAVIVGATLASYTVAEDDVGAKISVTVTATGAGGSADATSLQTAVVIA